MTKSRVLLLVAASFGFVLMLTSVTASSDFLYAPESTWRTSSDAAQDVAVAAWRAQTRASAQTTVTDDASASSSSEEPSSAPADSSASATTSSSASVESEASEASASSVRESSDDDDLPDWVPDWWNDFGDRDRDDGGRRGKDRKGRD